MSGGLQGKEIDVSGEVRSATASPLRGWSSASAGLEGLGVSRRAFLHSRMQGCSCCQHLPTTTSRPSLSLSTPTPPLSAPSRVLLWKASGVEPPSRVGKLAPKHTISTAQGFGTWKHDARLTDTTPNAQRYRAYRCRSQSRCQRRVAKQLKSRGRHETRVGEGVTAACQVRVEGDGVDLS